MVTIITTFEDLEERIRRTPTKVYKYTSTETCEKILENQSIQFTNPSQFNDPFDCQIKFEIGDYSQSKITKWAKEN